VVQELEMQEQPETRSVNLVTYLYGRRDILGKAEVSEERFTGRIFLTKVRKHPLIKMVEDGTFEEHGYHLKWYTQTLSHPEEVRVEWLPVNFRARN
jgi:hypothetical protein